MKRIIAILVSALMVLGACPSLAADGDVINAALPLLSALNIMVGDANGDMRLDSLVSRAEFTKVAVASSSYRHSVATSLKTSSYKDVSAGHWAAPYIKVGVVNGYCKGYSDATFRPDNTVTYEEAITILLRVLGYSDDDFGNSWPYGQVGMAENLGISDGVDVNIGDELSRREVAVLVFNTLETKMKNSTQQLLSIFDVEKKEDVLLTSINEKQNSARDEIRTSAGTFKFDTQIARTDIGREGDLYVENGNNVLAFVPYGGSGSTERHVVYSLLGDDVITYINGGMSMLNVPTDTPVYEDNTTSTYAAKSAGIEMGDILHISRSKNGEISDIIYEKGSVDGPYTVTSSFNLGKYGSAKVIRNGEASDINEIKSYDIIYYVSDLDMLMTYSNKITGIYEKAEPNKDAPTSVTVSGVTYHVESSAAFEKLSSAGEFKYGDTVTLLLGKTNDVADVMTSSSNETIYGYLLETGKKEFTKSDTSKYTNYYVKVALADGTEGEYAADKDYESKINSVQKITFSGGVASSATVTNKYSVSGTFNWADKAIGTERLSADVKILDVATSEENESPAYTTVYPSRLDGVKISSSSILYMGKDEKGQIDELILKDVTGDAYSYGIISEADIPKDPQGMFFRVSYTYDVGGVSKSFSSSSVMYNIRAGQAAQILVGANGTVQSMKAINSASGKVTDIFHTEMTIGGKKYPVSGNVAVYKSDSNYNYTLIPLSEIIDNNDYSITAFYDKSGELGGCVRVIIVK